MIGLTSDKRTAGNADVRFSPYALEQLDRHRYIASTPSPCSTLTRSASFEVAQFGG
jgi:hypothetical protein